MKEVSIGMEASEDFRMKSLRVLRLMCPKSVREDLYIVFFPSFTVMLLVTLLSELLLQHAIVVGTGAMRNKFCNIYS